MQDTLSLKLKHALVAVLTKSHDLDKPYLRSPNGKAKSSWTKREVANEILEETDFGIEMLTSIMYLSLDLLAREKEQMRYDTTIEAVNE